jgi:hypothetical protein
LVLTFFVQKSLFVKWNFVFIEMLKRMREREREREEKREKYTQPRRGRRGGDEAKNREIGEKKNKPTYL